MMNDDAPKPTPADPPFALYTDVNNVSFEVGSITRHPHFHGFAQAIRLSDGKPVTLDTSRLTFLAPKTQN